MNKLTGILIAVALLFSMIACQSSEFDISKYVSSIVYGAESSNTTPVEGNIMAVFYLKADQRVLFWGTNGEIVDRGDGKWDFTCDQLSASGISQATVTYGLYKYQLIEWEYEYDDLGIPTELPLYLSDLNLEPISADDLPRYEFIGELTSFNPVVSKPATVARKYLGVFYDVQCLVVQTVLDSYDGGDLQIGDYVLVLYIEEVPETGGRGVAIVTNKVYESW